MIHAENLKYALVAVVVLGAVLIGLAIRGWQRRAFRQRKLRDLSEVYESEVRQRGVDRETFEDVMNAVAKCFSLDPRVIKPTDSLRAFKAMDSWYLWHGWDQLEDWLARRGAEAPPNPPPKTVLDLIEYVARIPAGKTGP